MNTCIDVETKICSYLFFYDFIAYTQINKTTWYYTFPYLFNQYIPKEIINKPISEILSWCLGTRNRLLGRRYKFLLANIERKSSNSDWVWPILDYFWENEKNIDFSVSLAPQLACTGVLISFHLALYESFSSHRRIVVNYYARNQSVQIVLFLDEGATFKELHQCDGGLCAFNHLLLLQFFTKSNGKNYVKAFRTYIDLNTPIPKCIWDANTAGTQIEFLPKSGKFSYLCELRSIVGHNTITLEKVYWPDFDITKRIPSCKILDFLEKKTHIY